MQKRHRGIAVAVCLMFLGSVIFEGVSSDVPNSTQQTLLAKKGSRPPSRRPSRPSPSRRPSTGSRKPSTGSRKPSTGSRKPSTGSRKPSTPSSSNTSSKSRANAKTSSKRSYKATNKATSPAKKSYTNSRGKTVNVRRSSAAVTTMRSRPSSYYTPAARTTRHTTYITTHNYSHGYGWYGSQPYYSMGGGYSSAYWYMMMEWNADRRARWFYNNQSNIDASAYQRGIQDTEVQQRLTALESGGTARNTDYVDPEMTDNPGMQYSQDYVEAAYNPTVVATGGAASTVFGWICVIVFGFVAIWFMATKLRWGR